jgi:transcriptional regulator with XRE-family HTH domain
VKALGIASMTLYRYELGDRTPRLEDLERMAAVLEVPLHTLLGTQAPPAPPLHERLATDDADYTKEAARARVAIQVAFKAAFEATRASAEGTGDAAELAIKNAIVALGHVPGLREYVRLKTMLDATAAEADRQSDPMLALALKRGVATALGDLTEALRVLYFMADDVDGRLERVEKSARTAAETRRSRREPK